MKGGKSLLVEAELLAVGIILPPFYFSRGYFLIKIKNAV